MKAPDPKPAADRKPVSLRSLTTLTMDRCSRLLEKLPDRAAKVLVLNYLTSVHLLDPVPTVASPAPNGQASTGGPGA